MSEIKYGVCNAMVLIDNADIENIPSEVLDKLDCGDFIIKKTGNAKHRYFVSYKEDRVGICFTYVDASCVETISYDYSNEEHKWVFNSKDVWTAPDEE